ncbi:MAG: hypothetical protein ABSA76_02085 [Bacteroidales bacterium]
MKRVLNWNNLFLFLIFLFLLPDHLINLPHAGLESSWQIALNLAAKDGLVFGKDFIFTYGPLGFLATQVGLAMPYGSLCIFLFDLIIIGAILSAIARILREYNSIIVYGIVFIVAYHLAYAENTYRILVIVIFFLLQNIKKFNFYSLALVALLLAIQFFIKPSAAIYFIVIFFIALLYLVIYKRNKWAWAYMFSLVLIIFLLSKLLKVELPGYLTSTLELSRTYSDTMNYIALSKLKAVLSLLFAVFFIITFIIISLLTILKDKNPDTFFISGIVILSFFFLFKQSYVRFDSAHLLIFWSTVISIAFIFFYQTDHIPGSIIKYSYVTLLIILITAFSFFSKFRGAKYIVPLPVTYLSELPLSHFKNDYVKSASKFTELPELIRKTIGNNSIDVFPYDIYSVYFNRLNYKPRPVIQSYVATSTLLNTYNCNFYKSTSSPEFILYHNGSIDSRYPFWDESLTKQVLISDYEPYDSLFVWKEKSDTSFLLKKRINALTCNEKLMSDTLIESGEKYTLPKTGNLIYLSAELKYSTFGLLKNFLYHPPFIYIKLFLEDGGTGIYRLVVPEIKHGVIINKKLLTQSDAYLLYKYQGSENENITGFVILSGNKAYKSRFRIRLSELTYNQ